MALLKIFLYKVPKNTLASCGQVIILLCLVMSSYAQGATEEKVKAVFVYNFTQFVQWPEISFDDQSSPFIIGVAGNNLVTWLQQLTAGESYQGHPIQVRTVQTIQDAAMVHILFIDESESKQATILLRAVSGKPVLTVSDKSTFMKDGGIIRLFNEGGKIRVEVNSSKANDHQLSISAKLLNVARIYEEK